jgi:hypothetical protein
MLTIYQILNHLLISTEESITIDSTQNGACILTEEPEFEHERPSVVILQTCKRINEEGTPILYGRNNFTVCLRMSSLLISYELQLKIQIAQIQ